MRRALRDGGLVLICAFLIGGCAWFKPSPKSTATAAPAKGTGPLVYENASQGLPKSVIWKSQLDFGDVNGDGNSDIGAISRLHDGPYVWLSDGKGNWTNASNGLPRETFCGGGVAFGDINKDGKTDIAIGDHCKGAFALFGDGAGNWTMAASGLPTVGTEDIALGDVNNDGCLDVAIVTAQEEGIRVYTGNCKGSWKESSDGLPLGEWGNGVVMADMNKDGNIDIIAAYAPGPRVYLGNGKGAWREASEGLPAPEIHGLYWGIAVGDVNNDGLLDVAAGSAIPGAEVFIQEEGGKFRLASEGIVPMNALGVALGDLDKDGNVDLVVSGKTNTQEIGGVYGVHVFRGDGKGNWKYVTDSGLPLDGKERDWGVALGDANGDGVLDIGVAFGDVLPASWRSGKKEEGAKDKDKKTAAEKNPEAQAHGPERGRFGSVDVWFGELKK
jgi:hypothetical protein